MAIPLFSSSINFWRLLSDRFCLYIWRVVNSLSSLEITLTWLIVIIKTQTRSSTTDNLLFYKYRHGKKGLLALSSVSHSTWAVWFAHAVIGTFFRQQLVFPIFLFYCVSKLFLSVWTYLLTFWPYRNNLMKTGRLKIPWSISLMILVRCNRTINKQWLVWLI